MAEQQKTIKVWTRSLGYSKCRGPKCGQRIRWGEVVATGKKMCFEGSAEPVRLGEQGGQEYSEFDFADNHWAHCPDARRFDADGKKHKCAIKHCDERIPISFLMCTSHWRKVPEQLKRDVWKYYKQGQENEGIGATSEEWRRAADAAIKHVERRELGMFS